MFAIPFLIKKYSSEETDLSKYKIHQQPRVRTTLKKDSQGHQETHLFTFLCVKDWVIHSPNLFISFIFNVRLTCSFMSHIIYIYIVCAFLWPVWH
jgi:hypothetical protein